MSWEGRGGKEIGVGAKDFKPLSLLWEYFSSIMTVGQLFLLTKERENGNLYNLKMEKRETKKKREGWCCAHQR